jgi:hypothetical protein
MTMTIALPWTLSRAALDGFSPQCFARCHQIRESERAHLWRLWRARRAQQASSVPRGCEPRQKPPVTPAACPDPHMRGDNSALMSAKYRPESAKRCPTSNATMRVQIAEVPLPHRPNPREIIECAAQQTIAPHSCPSPSPSPHERAKEPDKQPNPIPSAILRACARDLSLRSR